MNLPILTYSDIRKLLSVINSPRDRAILVLFLSTGLFLHELIALDISDIQWSKKTLHIKGKRDRLLDLNPEAMDALTQWNNTRMDTPDPALFLTEKGTSKRLS